MSAIPFIEKTKSGFRVGAKYEDGAFGPVAEIYVSAGTRRRPATWINIVTDDHEGHAMLRIEALPHLIEALQAISASLVAPK